jgi:hypothetical protein
LAAEVAYIFRKRAGEWQYREFNPAQLQNLFGVSNIGELVMRMPDAPFERIAPR